MAVPMMQVGVVRMGMAQRRVAMPMRMRFTDRPVMGVPVVGVVLMAVLVFERLVPMPSNQRMRERAVMISSTMPSLTRLAALATLSRGAGEGLQEIDTGSCCRASDETEKPSLRLGGRRACGPRCFRADAHRGVSSGR